MFDEKIKITNSQGTTNKALAYTPDELKIEQSTYVNELAQVVTYIHRPLNVFSLEAIPEWAYQAASLAWNDIRGGRFTTEIFKAETILMQNLIEIAKDGDLQMYDSNGRIDVSTILSVLSQQLGFEDYVSYSPSLLIVHEVLGLGNVSYRGGAMASQGVAVVSLHAIEKLISAAKSNSDFDNANIFTDEQLSTELLRRLIRHELGHLHMLPDVMNGPVVKEKGAHCPGEAVCCMRSASNDEIWIEQIGSEIKHQNQSGNCFCSYCLAQLDALSLSIS
jgi:hypothetical protein